MWIRSCTALTTLLLAACSPQPASVVSVGWIGSDQLSEKDVYEDLTPSVPLLLDRPSKVTVQFMGEFKPGRVKVVSIGGATSPSPGTSGAAVATVSHQVSAAITLRVLVGGVVATPDELTGAGGSTAGTASHGIIAVVDNVPAGNPTVQVQWKSAVPGAVAMNRGMVVLTSEPTQLTR